MATRDADGNPLTLVQLQKDTFESVKKQQKSMLIRILEEKIKMLDGSLGLYTGPSLFNIELGCNNGDESLLIQTQEPYDTKFWKEPLIQTILQRWKQTKKTSIPSGLAGVVQPAEVVSISDEEINNFEINSQDYILNTLHDMENVDSEVINDIESVNIELNNDRQVHGRIDKPNDIWYNLAQDDSFLTDTFEIMYDSVSNENVYEEEITSGPSATGNYSGPSLAEAITEEGAGFVLNDDHKSKMLTGLKTCSNTKISQKWISKSVTDFTGMLTSALSISQNFTLNDIRVMIEPVIDIVKANKVKISKSWTKKMLVNILSELCGDASILQKSTGVSKKTKPSQILDNAAICIQMIKSLPKHDLNCIYAEIIWSKKLAEWRLKGPFRNGIKISATQYSYNIEWYSQPQFIKEIAQYHFDVLDAHHLLTNCRYKVCKTGMIKAGISKQPWHKIANSKTNSTGLSLPMVEEVIDRQSAAYAIKTFSIEVEEAMRVNGDTAEADFCALIRGYHEAVDEAGIPSKDRIQNLLSLREWLLQDVVFSKFPPPGLFIKDIPIIEFEGLLTSIERRIQLYSVVPGNSYNARSASSLDGENFFGAFQDLHPAGSGVLKPNEVPQALSTACEILATKMDSNR